MFFPYIFAIVIFKHFEITVVFTKMNFEIRVFQNSILLIYKKFSLIEINFVLK